MNSQVVLGFGGVGFHFAGSAAASVNRHSTGPRAEPSDCGLENSVMVGG